MLKPGKLWLGLAVLCAGACTRDVELLSARLELSSDDVEAGDEVVVSAFSAGERVLTTALSLVVDADYLELSATNAWSFSYHAVGAGVTQVALVQPYTGEVIDSVAVEIRCPPNSFADDWDSAPRVVHSGAAGAGIWRAADGVHVIDGLVEVDEDLTIETCAKVELRQDAELRNTSDARVRIHGTPEHPIDFVPAPEMTWRGIHLVESHAPHILAGMTVSGATGVSVTDERKASIVVEGAAPVVRRDSVATLSHLTIDGCVDAGVALRFAGTWTADPHSSVSFRDCATPYLADANSVAALPVARYDAVADEVECLGGWLGSGWYRWTNPGLPIRVRTSIHHAAAVDEPTPRIGPRTWGIGPGVELRFAEGTGVFVGAWAPNVTPPPEAQFIPWLNIDWSGTTFEPIVLTSDAPSGGKAPGQWQGVVFARDTRNLFRSRMYFTCVEFAGESVTDESLVPAPMSGGIIMGEAAVTTAELPPLFAGSVLRHNAGYGITLARAETVAVNFEEESLEQVPICLCGNSLGTFSSCSGDDCQRDCGACDAWLEDPN